ncbi:MAG: 4Fe-4S dicluster domain-containing protein [Desulfobacca sp.]|uniref:4Fe-4S dicluster domain-containing protein n=1 Tax=Desulfobacca sp. TaxID=2067990 RepID=UPI0040492E7B
MATAASYGLEPQFTLSDEILRDRRICVTDCYQCAKCSAGCPLTFAMDRLPHEIIRLAGLGQADLVLGSNTIWVCSACETCTTRCPNDIDIAGVMDYLKERAVRSGRPVPQPQVLAFHRAFLANIRLAAGRLHEPLLLGLYLLQSGQGLQRLRAGTLKEDLQLGLKMFRKGRLSLKPPRRLPQLESLAQLWRQPQS